jgi:hypothetical protein
MFDFVQTPYYLRNRIGELVMKYIPIPFVLLVCITALSLAVSCGATGSGGPPEIGSPTNEFNTALGSDLPSRPSNNEEFSWAIYYPFVEEVAVPETVIANVPFTITVHVSSAFHPAILKGLPNSRSAIGTTDLTIGARDGVLLNPYAVIPVDVDPSLSSSVFLPTSIINPYGSGTPATQFQFAVDGLPPGECRIAYYTTSDSTHGGIGWFYREITNNLMPGDPVEWLSQYVVKKEIVIAVLPAESGGEGV